MIQMSKCIANKDTNLNVTNTYTPYTYAIERFAYCQSDHIVTPGKMDASTEIFEIVSAPLAIAAVPASTIVMVADIHTLDL
jgi:hypothetical protein